MRPPRLNRWIDPLADEGLLLFAQRLEESVFDYTLDSHKVRALNTHTRCIELTDAIAETRREGLPKAILVPIVEELADSISSDPVAVHLLGAHTERFSHFGRWDVKTRKGLEIQARRLLSVIGPDYEAATIALLRDLIPAAHAKAEITALTVNLAVEWLNRGFTRGHVYSSVREFFFLPGDHEIEGLASLDDFLRRFPREACDWEVVVRATPSVRRLREILPPEVCTVQDDPPPADAPGDREAAFLAKDHDGVFLVFPNVRALDARGALEGAIRFIASLAGFANLHAHALRFETDGSGLVRSKDGEVLALRPPVPPIRKQRQGRGKDLRGKLMASARAMSPSTLEARSYQRMAAALRLHATALRAPSNEEQLYALWISLEALLPFEEAESRIGRICEVLVPLLSRSYPTKLIYDLHQDLRGCLGDTYQGAMREIPGARSDLERATALVCAEDAQALRDRLFAGCTENPLLRFRLYEVSEALLSADRVLATIDRHERRVEWHLRRIYRTRNSLVHSGRSLPYLEAMVESLHAYVWRIIELAQEALAKDGHGQDLDTALLAGRIDHEAHVGVLRRAAVSPVRIENCRRLVLGDVG